MKENYFCHGFHKKSQNYFSGYKKEIADNNLILLQQAGWIYTILLCLYSVVAVFLFREVKLNITYAIFLSLALIMLFSIYYMSKRKTASYCLIQAFCTMFVCMVMSFVIVISVFPFPDRPGIFFPVVYLILTAVFILPMWKIHLILTGSLGIYLCFCYFYKTPWCLGYDIFSSITVWVVGFLFSYLILDLRLREHWVRCKLERISMIDELTQLPNRRAFNRYIEQVSLAARDQKLPCAALMIDVDKFKDYNDRFGHVSGDECLKKLALVLKNAVQGQGGTAFRYGGEEFVCILEDCERYKALHIAENILKRVAQSPVNSEENGYVTVSIGVALWQRTMESDSISIIKKADTALYRAKAQGRNRIIFYEENMIADDAQA